MKTGFFTFFGALRKQWFTLLQVHLIFTFFGIVTLGPIGSLLLQIALGSSANGVVVDQDILWLFMTPAGIVCGVFLAGCLMAVAAMEVAAMLAVLMADRFSMACTSVQASGFALRHSMALLRLALIMTLQIIARTLPLLVVLAITAWILLFEYDINYYLTMKPPGFWWALLVTAIAGLVYVWVMGRQLLRWCFALPLVLFANLDASAALNVSDRRTRDSLYEIFCAYAFCFAGVSLAGAIPLILFDLIGGWVVAFPYQRLELLVFVLVCLLAAWTLINIALAAFALAGFCAITVQLYTRLGVEVGGLNCPDSLDFGPFERRGKYIWGKPPMLLVLATFIGLTVLSVYRFVGIVQSPDVTEIVAHRGAAGAAPENTLEAVRRAIEDGADWVEIDVQESRDGHVVVFHDSDFMKLSGNPAKLWELDLAEIQRQDVGSWFDADFANERVPTLQQALEAVRGRARLMIELKYYGYDQSLEQSVVELVEAAGMADEVAIMSLKLEGVQKLQALRPHWNVGLLAASSAGDLTRLNVDFLALNGRMLTTQFIRRAHENNKRVLVWTVNDAPSLSRWMSMGVDGVITDEPALAREVLEERSQMSIVERLLVSAALFLGTPASPTYRDDSP
jgi:glycerophosphoryl diester phosphodiesterase